MRRAFNIFLMLLPLALCWGCNMDLYRSDTMTSAQFKSDPGAAVYSTDGNYSLFKNTQSYKGSTDSGLTFVKLWNHMSVMRGDDAVLSGKTTSPIYNSACYDDNSLLKHSYFFWWICYKIIYSANSVIEMLPEGESDAQDQLLGENYTMRAYCHLCLSCLYSKQYPLGRDNMGVVLRTSTDCSVTKRATVGEVYDQIEADLIKAAALMKTDANCRGDHGYISYSTAKALLTRVYLFEEKNQECLDLCNELLGSDPASFLDPDLEGYIAKARTSKETLWCITHVIPEDNLNRSSLGSMYYSPDGTGGTGWGGVYWSDPLIELFQRYPQDKRFKAYFHQYGKLDDGTKMVYWPIDDGVNPFRSNAIVAGKDKGLTAAADGSYTFKYQEKSYTAKPETDANGYTKYFITYNGAKTQVYVRDNCDYTTGTRNTYPQFYMSKFSHSLTGAESQISSPVQIRWAEVILNRAEANAKLGHDAEALKDVNVIRTRAGLTGDAQMTESNYKARGYASVLDVVLDERRMELCFEAQRPFDLIRNKRNIDHRYAGVQPWVEYKYDCDEFLFSIPQDEIAVSGIPQNPGK